MAKRTFCHECGTAIYNSNETKCIGCRTGERGLMEDLPEILGPQGKPYAIIGVIVIGMVLIGIVTWILLH